MRPRAPHLLLILLLAACASPPPDPQAPIGDPWKPVNGPVFSFNLKVDDYVLRPVSRGWNFITWRGARIAIDKFFTNLSFPVRFVSNLGQGEMVHAGSELGRFVLNSTVGIVGFFDPASHIGMERYDEDVGQMMGRWRIASGPYWMIPLLGPSSPRDAVGLVFDTALNLRSWLIPFFIGGSVDLINQRALADPQIEAAREGALDYYVFIRDAYVQRRRAQVLNRDLDDLESEGEPSDDLYEIDPDLYELDTDLYELDTEAVDEQP